jgi:hypothetical protein
MTHCVIFQTNHCVTYFFCVTIPMGGIRKGWRSANVAEVLHIHVWRQNKKDLLKSFYGGGRRNKKKNFLDFWIHEFIKLFIKIYLNLYSIFYTFLNFFFKFQGFTEDYQCFMLLRTIKDTFKLSKQKLNDTQE